MAGGFPIVVRMDDRAHTSPGQFLGFPLYTGTTSDFLCEVIEAAQARRLRRIGYLNAAQVNLAYADRAHGRHLAAMDILYADGQAVVWGGRLHHVPVAERINAGDFTHELIDALADRGLRLALVGGRPADGTTPAEAERAAATFRQWRPDLQIVLTLDGYFPECDAPGVLKRIDDADPDLVLLGMGAPLQERRAIAWAAAAQRPRVWWCVGALLEYYAGTRLRAPVWMRRAGLEWTVRLALEPGRLWRRYLIGNPLFIARVLRGRPPAINR